MKTRNGFVSNSSSSSFIVLGFKINTEDYDKREFLQKYAPKVWAKLGEDVDEMDVEDSFFDFWQQSDLMGIKGAGAVPADDTYVGVVFADVASDGDSLDDAEYDIADALDTCKKIKKALDLPGDPKLYTGTRSC